MFEAMKRRSKFEIGQNVHFVYNGYAFLGTVRQVTDDSYFVEAFEQHKDEVVKMAGSEIVEVKHSQVY